MKKRTMKAHAQAPMKMRLLILIVAGCLAGWGCQDPSMTVGNSNQGDGDSQEENNVNQDHEHSNQLDEHGHGPDEDEVLIEPGLLNGSWRAALAENDAPMAYFDIFHDEGETSGTGNYLMGFVLGPDFDGSAGDLADVEFTGESVEIAWNPTADDAEMYWVELTRETEDRFTGVFKAEKRPDVFDVVVERRVFEDDSDAVPTDDEYHLDD